MSTIILNVALLGYPLIAILLFRRLPLTGALIWTLFLGYMFLPEGHVIDIPFFRDLDKHTVPAVCALLLALSYGNKEMRRIARQTVRAAGSVRQGAVKKIVSRRKHPLIVGLMLLFFLTPLAVAYTNTDAVRIGPISLWPMSTFDGLSMMQGAMLTLIPFFLARHYLSTPKAQLALLQAMVIAALIYTIPMLWEVRFSPQLHRMIYGYHQHSFAQHVRDGYRPMMFLSHGLAVGVFIGMGCLAAATLWRASTTRKAEAEQLRKLNARRGIPETAPDSDLTEVAVEATGRPAHRRNIRQPNDPLRRPGRWAITLIWLVFILVLSRNMGSTAIAFGLLPFILLAGIRIQLLLVAVIGIFILVFPMMRGAGLVPINTVVEWSARISQERADSLSFRLHHEDLLLAKANERPVFGWGTWGRNRIRDAETGQDISVSDGDWIIAIGVTGWVGYLARYGLLVVPVLLLARRRRGDLDQVAAGLAMMLTLNLIDAIPNANITVLTWIIAGSLAGRVEMTSRVPRPARRAAGLEAGGRPERQALA